MPSPNQIRNALSNPISWVVGAVGSVLAIAASLGVDPITASIIIATVVWNNAMTIFTGSSIIGFTLAPEIDMIPARPFQVAAVIVGFIVVGNILSKLFNRVESRLGGS